MKKMLRLLVLCVLAGMAQAAPVKVTEIEGVSEYRLDNGLKVLLVPDVSKPTITVNVTYLVGSRHEGGGEAGMAHLLEHMLFKGTPAIPDLPKELSRRGMQPNGTTSYDRTNYFETFAANEDYLDWALGMEADRMVNAKVAEADLRSEMTVVRNEMERGENNPGYVLRNLMLSAAYQWHPYGRSVIGARSDVENVGIANLQAFYRKYYQPDNAVLIVAGKFDLAKTLALVEKQFGPIPRPTRQLPRLYTVEPPQEGERSVRLERLAEERRVGVMYHVPAGATADSVALDLLVTAMVDVPSGRLYKALVESGKAVAVSGGNQDLFDPGFAQFSVQMRKADSPEEVRRILLDTLEGTMANPISAKELDDARRLVLNSYEKLESDSSNLAMALSNSVALGDWRLYFWARDQYAKVDVSEVNHLAQRYFRAANRTMGELVPQERSSQVPVPPTPDRALQLQGYTGKVAQAAGEVFDTSPEHIAARTRYFTLGNGMQLALLPKQNRGQTVRANLQLNFGDADSLRGQADAAYYTASMLSRGTLKRDRAGITTELERLRSKIQIGGGGQSVSVTVESVRENLPATLKLLREILREPSFPPSEWEQLVKQVRSGIETGRLQPETVSDYALAQHFNDFPPDDIRASRSFDQQLQGLAALKVADLQRFHARFYGADHAQFAVVGDFDAAEINQLAAELFGDWKSNARWEKLPQPFRAVPAKVQVLETPDKQNAVFRAALRIPVGDSHPDYPALLVASQIMGGGFISSRLANRLRQKEGISYSVAAWLHVDRQEQNGRLSAYAIYAPQFRAKIAQAFTEEFTQALSEGFSEQEVSDAKTSLLQIMAMSRAQDGGLAGSLISNLYYGQDWTRIRQRETAIQALTTAQVNAAFKRIDPAAFSQFYAGDFSKTANTK